MIFFWKNSKKIFLNILTSSLILIYLFFISIVNIENIYQRNILDIPTLLYYLYFFVSFLGLIYLRFFYNKISKYRQEYVYFFSFIFIISLFIIPSIYINHYFILEKLWNPNLYLRSYGKIAFLYFALALVVSPIISLFKNSINRDLFLLIRKLLWILSFIFFLKHWLEYFASEYIYYFQNNPWISYFAYAYNNILKWNDAISWVIAWILMLLLWLTSNRFSIKLLWWKKWKILQSLVYPGFLLSALHIAFASRFDIFYTILIIFVVFIRTFSYVSSNKVKKTWKIVKYICIPCGYIYDENKWDPDSWIAPWTKFEDIPDSWRCPVCWVTKADFEAYYEDENTVLWGIISKVVWYNMLTDDVLELKIELTTKLEVMPWQYAIIILKDFDWEFKRAFSVVDYKDNILTFWIKIKDTWRWWRALKNIQLWDTLKLQWIYWDFILKNNSNPKVFIATWTWISPIMHMLKYFKKESKGRLFFWVQKEKDLFFLDKIKSFTYIETTISLSREKTQKYNYWRIDLSSCSFPKETDFYICWNPAMVASNIDTLKNRGYQNIYSEKF